MNDRLREAMKPDERYFESFPVPTRDELAERYKPTLGNPSRIMELFEQEVAGMRFFERIRFRFSIAFGHPARGPWFERLKDTVSRWILWHMPLKRRTRLQWRAKARKMLGDSLKTAPETH